MEEVYNKKKIKLKLGNKLNKNLFLYFLQFILTGIAFFDQSYLLTNVAYIFNSNFVNKTILKLIVVFSLFGKVSEGIILEYIGILFIYDYANKYFKDCIGKTFIMSSTYFVVKIFEAFVTDSFTLYNVLLYLLEGIIIFTISIILDRFLKVTFGQVNKTKINEEETISLMFIATLILTGLGNISMFSINFLHITGYVFILLMGLSGGMLYGAMAGSVMTIAILISGNNFNEYYLLIPIVSMITGIFKNTGKAVMCIIFSVLSAFLYLTNGIIMLDGIEFAKNILISIIIFYMIPTDINSKIERLFNINNASVKKESIKKIKSEISFSLENFAESFIKLANTYDEASTITKTSSKIEAEKILEQIIKLECKNCQDYERCWQNNFYVTNKNFYEIMNYIETEASIDKDVIAGNYEKWCKNINSLIINILDAMKNEKYKIYLSNKIQKNKRLLADQLYEIANLVQNIVKNIETGKNIYEELEEKIIDDLAKLGINTEEVIVLKNKDKYKIEILIEPININIEDIVRSVEYIINKRLKTVDIKREMDLIRFVLAEKENFNVEFAAIKQYLSQDNECGDNYMQIEMDDGNYVVGISDGMGTGMQAESESRLTLELIEKFIDMGFSKNFIIKSINSIMQMNSIEELYATLDLIIIDRDIGRLELVKVGSFPTFVKKNSGIEIIEAESLPIGLVDEINLNIIEKDLSDGDIIVAMTDGFISKNIGLEEVKESVKEILMNVYNNNSREIAQYILEGMKAKYNNEINDDITIAVSKIAKTY